MSSSLHNMRTRKCWRYESGPDDLPQQPYSCSSNPGNAEATPTMFPSTPTENSQRRNHFGKSYDSSSFSRTTSTTYEPPLPYMKMRMTVTPKKRIRSTSSSTEHHQPIGFVCCQCRYRSSGTYCSNPDYAECPHKITPRCGNCPIIFTPPRLRGDT